MMDTTEKRFQQLLRMLLPVMILVVGVAGFAAISRRDPRPSSVVVEEPIPLVRTEPVVAHNSGFQIEVDGLVVPYREVGLSAEVAGRITFKSPECRPGRFVTAETVLFEIDPESYQLEVERLEQELEQADADLIELNVQVENTQRLIELAKEEVGLRRNHLSRVEQLSQRSVATQTDLDEARRMELSARDALMTQENQLRALDSRRGKLAAARKLVAARLKQAQLDLSRTQIRAPIDGVILRDNVEQDGYVQPGAALVTIEDTSAAEVKCSLKMEELHWIWKQSAASTALAPAGPGHDYALPKTEVVVSYRLGGHEFSWSGILDRYDGLGLDEKTRTVPCRIFVGDPQNPRVDGRSEDAFGGGPQALVRGMFVSVQIPVTPPDLLLRIPERALRPGNFVWRTHNDQLEILEVDVIKRVGKDALVRERASGLSAGDRIVVTPLSVATDGMLVREEAQQ